MEPIVLFQIPMEELKTIIAECITTAIENLPDKKNQVEDELLTIEEASKFLKVSRVTLFKWIKKGIVTPVRFGNSPRLKKSELLKIPETKTRGRRS